MKYFLLYYLIISLITFLLYGIDKRKAQKKAYRISEKTLILFSFLGGAIGALGGMFLFHHKTKHIKFIILIPISILLHIGLFYFLFLK